MTNRMIHTPSFLATADIGLYWTGVGAAMTVTSGWYVGSSNSGPNNLMSRTFDSQAGWTIGFRFKYSGVADTAPLTLIRFMDGTTTHVEWDFTASTGLWRVTRNGTVLLTGTTALLPNVEYYIEMQTLISDTVGVAILKIDGVTDAGINSSALDTRNAGNASANILQVQSLTGSGRITPQFKDFYLNDNAGGVDDTFWGPITVGTLSPSSAGNKSQWTPSASTNVSNVDDATQDGDTTYNATSTLNQIDSFVATDTGYASGTVKGVEVVNIARRTDASSTARIAPLWRISGTDYVGTDAVLPFNYLALIQRYRVSPASSAAWTVSELDGAEIGYKRTAL